MILRILNFVVIGALVLAAAYVYRIKFDSTVQAEHLAKLRGEVRHERDAIAALRADWGELDNPARIEDAGQAFSPAQAGRADPIRHASITCPNGRPMTPAPRNDDPIGGMIEQFGSADDDGKHPGAGRHAADQPQRSADARQAERYSQ